MPTFAERLGDFVVNYSFEDLPDAVVEKAKLAIRDQVGCQLLGSTLPWVQAPYRMVRQLGEDGPATIVNHGVRTTAPNAAMTNAVFGHSAELDDYGAGVGAHSGSVCLAVALALGESLGKSGKDVLAALALGYDTAWILGETMHKELVHRGIHAHAVLSTFSATSVASRLLDLTALQAANAFAVAASSAFGTMEFYRSGGEVKRFHSGKAAKAGIEAALLAAHGLTGPLTILEGEWGLLALLAGVEPGTRDIYVRTGVGMANNCFKFYPTLAVQQSPIRIVHELLGETPPDEVASVRVSLQAGAVRDTGSFDAPSSPVSAQVSLPYSLSLAVARRSNDLALYTDPSAWTADDVRAAARKVQLSANPDARGKYDCQVAITLTDGRVLGGASEYPRGSHWNPASGDELEAKFRRIARDVLPPAQLDQIVAATAGIEDVADISSFTRLLVRR
jgi:2-methylcitrate dehydratase PrpD